MAWHSTCNHWLGLLIDVTKFQSEVVPQIDSQRIFVTQQYPANKLFKVTKTYVAADMMDISLSEGDIVGVVMDKDPMGNKDRWFVDNGGKFG